MTLFADWPLHSEPCFWASPPGGGSSSTPSRRFTVARDCGHYTRPETSAGRWPTSEWCGRCDRRVGLIVSEV